ncbi:MAG TPA: biopolymer transporter ExbD [Phycisphaerae bacterium]|nr:biopolymer transporter ExbD [Phycisphaerae bacterium]
MARRGIPPAHAAIPNLAPMVDVVMVILIFFMLGTTFAISEGILPTQLPSQVGPGGGAAITIVPSVRIMLLERPGATCRILVMDRPLERNTFDELGGFLREKRVAGADATAPVLIAAEGGVQYQDVISAMDACVQAGFRNIQFSVNAAAIQGETDTPRAP